MSFHITTRNTCPGMSVCFWTCVLAHGEVDLEGVSMNRVRVPQQCSEVGDVTSKQTVYLDASIK